MCCFLIKNSQTWAAEKLWIINISVISHVKVHIFSYANGLFYTGLFVDLLLWMLTSFGSLIVAGCRHQFYRDCFLCEGMIWQRFLNFQMFQWIISSIIETTTLARVYFLDGTARKAENLQFQTSSFVWTWNVSASRPDRAKFGSWLAKWSVPHGLLCI